MKDWKAIHREAFFWVVLILSVTYKATSYKEDTDQCGTRKMDLVVILDGTISLGYDAFDIEKELVLSILRKMTFGPWAIQLSVIQFSDQWSTAVEMEMGMHGGQADILSNVSSIEYQQGRHTLTGMAMHLAYEEFFGGKSKARPDVDKAILLITDGKPVDVDFLEKVVRHLKEKQVRIVTVATGTTMSHIQKFRYIVRSIASGFEEGLRAVHHDMLKIVGNVAKQLCKKIQPPSPPKGKSQLKQKCFQEKKDILFALDGSIKVDTATFQKALRLVSSICGDLDITPSLIHVGVIQYSDSLNTRIEFGLEQYTKYYQINESLQNIIHSKGRRSDLESALTIIEKEIFNGENGDRISAEDFLVLFVSDRAKQSDQVLRKVQKLKAKGVHVIIIGLGKPDKNLLEYYEKLASHPNDVNYLDALELKHIVGDLTAITCRKVNCKDSELKEKDKEKRASEEDSACKQQAQDVLFMLDTTRNMNNHFARALKFFTKVVKKLNIAASTTRVGLMTFGKNGGNLEMELGTYTFENDINKNILQVEQRNKWNHRADISSALRKVNKEIFNTSTGGYRKEANDLILIATLGNARRRDRYRIQNEVKILKEKGVRIAVLNVGYKKPVTEYLNTLHDIASGARDVYPMDFRRASTISQSLLDVECRVEEKTVSPQCFTRSRQILFMLDSSRGLGYKELPQVLTFLRNIVTKLYTDPNNIEIGLMHYSDRNTASYLLPLKQRTLYQTLKGMYSLKYRYRQGRYNYLGSALKYAKKSYMKRLREANQDRIIVLLAHNEPADPEKAFRINEKLRSIGVQIVTVAIHLEKSPVRLNPQYRALATSRANAHSFDLESLAESSMDILLNLCELNTCPEDSTKDCTPKKQDIFMVVDSSRSIGQENYPHLRRFIRRLVNKLDVSQNRSHVGILQASDSRRTEYEMKLGEFTNIKEIESVINDMGYHQGYTSFIGRGIEKAIKDNLFNASFDVISNGFGTNSDRSDAENVLMIYSDGVFHDERLALKITTDLKKQGVRVVIVGLGRDSRRPRAKVILEELASSRSDVYLVNLMRPSLLVEEELNEVTQHVTTLQCHNKYKAPISCSPESLDLFVVVDGSRSVGYVNFGKVQEFLIKLANEFAIGKNKAHFGVLQFGKRSQSRIEFNLGDYFSNKAVEKAIKAMKFLDSTKTETGHALSVVNTQIFNGTGVDRPGIPNILILFTDGVAHDISLAYDQAEKLKRRGTRIIAIGAGKQANKVFRQIRRVASSPEDAHKSEFDKLSGIVDDLLDVVCR